MFHYFTSRMNFRFLTIALLFLCLYEEGLIEAFTNRRNAVPFSTSSNLKRSRISRGGSPSPFVLQLGKFSVNDFLKDAQRLREEAEQLELKTREMEKNATIDQGMPTELMNDFVSTTVLREAARNMSLSREKGNLEKNETRALKPKSPVVIDRNTDSKRRDDLLRKLNGDDIQKTIRQSVSRDSNRPARTNTATTRTQTTIDMVSHDDNDARSASASDVVVNLSQVPFGRCNRALQLLDEIIASNLTLPSAEWKLFQELNISSLPPSKQIYPTIKSFWKRTSARFFSYILYSSNIAVDSEDPASKLGLETLVNLFLLDLADLQDEDFAMDPNKYKDVESIGTDVYQLFQSKDGNPYPVVLGQLMEKYKRKEDRASLESNTDNRMDYVGSLGSEMGGGKDGKVGSEDESEEGGLLQDIQDQVSDTATSLISISTLKATRESGTSSKMSIDDILQILEKILIVESRDLCDYVKFKEKSNQLDDGISIINIARRARNCFLSTCKVVFQYLRTSEPLDNIRDKMMNHIKQLLDVYDTLERRSKMDFDSMATAAMKTAFDDDPTLLQKADDEGNHSSLTAMLQADSKILESLQFLFSESKILEVAIEDKGDTFQVEARIKGDTPEDLPTRLEDFFSNFLLPQNNTLDTYSTVSELFIAENFDFSYRYDGLAISRDGAGRFQTELLDDIFITNSVKMSQGCAIFRGSILPNKTELFFEKLEEKFQKSDMNEVVDYCIVMDELIPRVNLGMQQAMLDLMADKTPCVIIFPKGFKSYAEVNSNTSSTQFWSSSFTSAAVVLSGLFALNTFGGLHTPDTTMSTMSLPAISNIVNVLPQLFLLTLTPVLLEMISRVSESVAATSKGFKTKWFLLPSLLSLTLPTFGSRSTHLGIAKTRNDVFDVYATGLATSTILSLFCFILGLTFTANATNNMLATYPALPLPLLKVNTIISQFITSLCFPDLYTTTSSLSIQEASATLVHLHWLAIAGIIGFINSTLQIIPMDNTAGSKITFAALGREYSLVLISLIGIVRFLFFASFLFSGAEAVDFVTTSRLFFDYIVISQISYDAGETPTIKDTLSSISEGRKIIYMGFLSILFLSYFPYQQIADGLTSLESYASAFIQNLF